MSATTLYLLSAVVLFAIGVHALVQRAHAIMKLLAINVIASAVFLLLIGIARRTPEAAPDPVPHAMVLTGIVVAVSGTALALALIRRLRAETGRDGIEDDDGR